MRSGVTLAVLRKEVQIEAGLSTQSGSNTFSVDRINQLLNRLERSLSREYEWPLRHSEQQITVDADVQYVDLPTNFDRTMIETINVRFGSDWQPLRYGISAVERSIYTGTQRATPICRYEFSADEPTRMEVWPVGATAQQLLISGQLRFGEMGKDDDVCVLDGDVLVLRAAAEIIGRDNRADAQLKLEAAGSLMQSILKRQGSARREPFSMVGGAQPVGRPGIDYIPAEE